MKIAVIHWKDALGTRYQISKHLAESLKPMPMVTAGILVKEDDDVIIVAQDYIEDEDDKSIDFRCLALIPKVNVISVETLETKE